MAKKSVEQLAEFYSGGSLVDSPWRGTTEYYGPEYLDLDSLAETMRERVEGRSASPIRREIAIGESAIRIIRKPIGNGGKPDNY